MKRDLRKVQQDLLARQSKPVKLRVAASIAHHELTGKKREAMLAKEYFDALTAAAAQLAHVADVYHVNEAGRLLRVPTEDLLAGTIANGGDILRMPNGFVYRALSMRRADVMDAISALKSAQAAIRQGAEHIENT
jgi:hypothetical protein